MNKYITDNELIIVVLGLIAAGSFLTKQFDLAGTVASGLIGFLGGIALNE